MVQRKQELTKFFVWLRNGTSFVVTWLLIILLVASRALNVPTLAVDFLAKVVILASGGVFLFCVSFTKLILKRWRFIKRLSFFFVALGIYQMAGFYWLGFFGERGNAWHWGIYALMVLVSYLCCMAVYQIYSTQKGKGYTRALNEYQKKRGENHGT